MIKNACLLLSNSLFVDPLTLTLKKTFSVNCYCFRLTEESYGWSKCRLGPQFHYKNQLVILLPQVIFILSHDMINILKCKRTFSTLRPAPVCLHVDCWGQCIFLHIGVIPHWECTVVRRTSPFNVYPHRCCSAKSPPRMPGRDSNRTLRKSGSLTNDLRHTPCMIMTMNACPFSAHASINFTGHLVNVSVTLV